MTTAATEITQRPQIRGGPRGLVRLANIAVWVLATLFFIGAMYRFNDGAHPFGLDSHAYWLSGHHSHLYGLAPGKNDAYLYSPAFATVVWPLAQLPWTAFLVLWSLIEFAAFVWLLTPLPVRWSVPLLLVCAAEAIAGDIYGLLGVVAVLGFSRPALWAFPALTKIAPALGIPWFALRREWRALSIAIATTAVIAAISAAITPHAWADWFRFLIDHRGRSTLLWPVRLPIGLIVLGYAARKDRRWLLPVAMMLALPMAGNIWTVTMLAPIPRLLTTHRETAAPTATREAVAA